MFIPRLLEPRIHELLAWFPVVNLTGPRQSGKSTLLKRCLPAYKYFNLEDSGLAEIVSADPLGFLRAQTEPIVLDEAQNAPELFSAVQVVTDERDRPGQVVLSGSQNFLVAEKIGQSLAGRVGNLTLLPLSYRELNEAPVELFALRAQENTHNKVQVNYRLDEFALAGGYPRLYNAGIPAKVYYENYVKTYLERDVSQFMNVTKINTFRRFVKLCALNTGNLLNATRMASELDISFPTVKNWLSILESSYIITLLYPWASNGRKTLTKTPKLYFNDTGLLCHLLGITDMASFVLHKHAGAVYENLIIAETMKNYLHAGETPELYFYRDDSKREVDLLDATGPDVRAIEIKSSSTFRSSHVRSLVNVSEELGIDPARRFLVNRGQYTLMQKGYQLISGRDFLTM
ncbi:ATP-binding protein [Trueperella pyogenes]|uniref:ATP-binding protein n=1 Tax=Trueperella pyogenes TaxID=1661 RepID=UPI000DF9BC83|nr:ATP-binding protein [Trueperella pyogenes]MBB3024997.1 hypothetical protein [Trueperella pyogenes]SUO87627.1 Uncharacterised protein [Trueperella pyogenes]